MAAAISSLTAKTADATPLTPKIVFYDLSGTGAGPWAPAYMALDASGNPITSANPAFVHDAGADAALATLHGDLQALATALPLPSNAAQETGGNLAAIASSTAAGATAANQTAANTTLSSILTKLGSAVLGAGSAIVGKFGIDQTTPGSTNGVVVNSGAVTANAGTNLNTSALALESGGNLASIASNGAKAANQPSVVATTAGAAARGLIVDPTTGNAALVQAFHNADNQALAGTAYGVMTGGVDQLVNGSGNLDRKRGVSGDAMAVTGLAAEVPMIFNGATYDRWYGDKTNGAWVNVKASAALVTSSAGSTGADYSINAPALPNVGANFGSSGVYANYNLITTVPASATRNNVDIENTSGAQIVVVRDDGTASAGAAPAEASVFALVGGAAAGAQGGGWSSQTFKGRLQIYAVSTAAQVAVFVD